MAKGRRKEKPRILICLNRKEGFANKLLLEEAISRMNPKQYLHSNKLKLTNFINKCFYVNGVCLLNCFTYEKEKNNSKRNRKTQKKVTHSRDSCKTMHPSEVKGLLLFIYI